MLRLILLPLLLTLTATAVLPAQGTAERARTRTERRANSRVDHKIDQGVDRAMNAIEGLFKKKRGTEAAAEPMVAGDTAVTPSTVLDIMGAGGAFTPFENAEEFTLRMEMTELRGKREEHATVALGALHTAIAMRTEGQEGTARLIFDTQDGKTTTITTDRQGQTQAYRMRMPNLGDRIAAEQARAGADLRITRTGERRTIDGYACELVVVEDAGAGTTTRSWMTPEVALDAATAFGAVARMWGGQGTAGVPLPPAAAELAGFFPIESTTVDGRSTHVLRVRDIRTGGAVDRALFRVDVPVREL